MISFKQLNNNGNLSLFIISIIILFGSGFLAGQLSIFGGLLLIPVVIVSMFLIFKSLQTESFSKPDETN